MLVKIALVVLLLTSLLTTGMDDQQSTAEQAVVTEKPADVKAVSVVDESAAGWAEDFTPITFVSYR